MNRKNALGRLRVCPVAMLLLLQACATVGAGGGLGRQTEAEVPPPWATRSEQEDEEARKAEAAVAMASMRGVASTVEQIGAELVFRFWAQNGALTMLSWQRTSDGAGPAAVSNTFVPGLEANLLTYLGTHTGEVHLTLRRQQQGWRLHSYATASGPKPPEAKTLPVRRIGVTWETLTQTHAVASRLARGVHLPEGGSTLLLAEVHLDDDLILEATTVRHETQGGAPGQPPAPGVEAALTEALLPFTHGVGPRTVRLRLDASHPQGPASAHWRVVKVETLPPPPPADPTLIDEHYALYERILREWREETKAAVRLAGVTSAEFLATWFISGLVLRGGHLLLEALAPRLATILARGGAGAVEWFRSFLARVRTPDREKFYRLWEKAQTKGVSASERSQLKRLMHQFEESLEARLDDVAKGQLRNSAHTDFYTRHHPGLARLLVDASNNLYPIHHRTPLEYAHLFPRLNINTSANLTAVELAVHKKINRVWTSFRAAGKKASAADVEEVVAIVDKHFGRWYNQVYEPRRSTHMLDAAAQAAIQEVTNLLNVIAKRG
jgi:hypothetical protein